MKLTLTEKRKEAGDAVSFLFATDSPFSWIAGQYLRITLHHENEDNRKAKRHFTISSAPSEGHVMITTRFPEKSSTFKQALATFPVGNSIDLDELEGDFTIADPNKEFVFIAGGIGITPYRSMLMDMDAKNLAIKATLLYGNSTNEFVFKEELEALAQKHEELRIKYVVAPERIDEQMIRKEIPDPAKPIFYVSGPEPMVEAFETMIHGMGIPDDRFKRDFFPGYTWQ